ncbi:MAG: YdcF family protein [Chitinophagaceae bacterium]|nr:YdcF family protein [Chitinophagaceae bacterium]MCB9047102.1 YdcF family protein [Chitinophagales bacterium]
MGRRLFKYFLVAILLLIILVFGIDAYVSYSVKKQIHDNIRTIQHAKVGLVLGTSKYVATGRINLYYKYRIEAAVKLYKAGKIDFILVSGDNRKMNYNEPATMKKDLIAAGVPESRIFLDYAGFRTLDSVVRSNAVFGTDGAIIISQRFHNERALFIANSRGIKAIAYNAQDPPAKFQVKVMIREKLARVKMLLDLLLNKQPRFFGDKIDIEDNTDGHPDLNKNGTAILNISISSKNRSIDSATYNGICGTWTMDSLTASKLLNHFKPIDGQQWHYFYDVLPCEVSGRLKTGDTEYAFSINAGSYLVLYNQQTNFYYGYVGDSCKKYFLSPPATLEELE